MFRGVTQLNIDSKGRLAVPTRYRDRLQELCEGRLVLTVSSDGCLLLYPQSVWEEIEAKLSRLPSLDRQARRLQRLMIGHAEDVELDAQGRILVPGPLRSYAGLDKRAVLSGQGHKFELWDEVTWSEQVETWVAEEREEGGSPHSTALESLSF